MSISAATPSCRCASTSRTAGRRWSSGSRRGGRTRTAAARSRSASRSARSTAPSGARGSGRSPPDGRSTPARRSRAGRSLHRVLHRPSLGRASRPRLGSASVTGSGMFDRLILNEELVGCRGEVIAARGTVLSLETVAEVARRAPALPRRTLDETALAADVEVPLDAAVYRHLFEGDAVRDAVRCALRTIRLPEVLFEELLALRRAASPIHAHGFATAAIAVRMLL